MSYEWSFSETTLWAVSAFSFCMNSMSFWFLSLVGVISQPMATLPPPPPTSSEWQMRDCSSLSSTPPALSVVLQGEIVDVYIQHTSHVWFSLPQLRYTYISSISFRPLTPHAYLSSCTHACIQVCHSYWKVPDQIWHLPWSFWPRRPGRSVLITYEISIVGFS